MSEARPVLERQEGVISGPRARQGGRHLGARSLDDRTAVFRIWAPFAKQVDVHLLEPEDRLVTLRPTKHGYHEGTIDDCPPGALYQYRLDGNEKEELPDPASRHQPRGVHGPSELVAQYDQWTDTAWRGIPLEESVLYELHVGTFTEEGTFEAAIDELDALKDLGVTVVELMPVAQFPGDRNWGYDGVLPFATQDTYGGPHGLARFVDACHSRGLAVALDVVYNHLGPEGNILHRFGPYFTKRYATPWGEALNFDGRESDQVRRYFIENALYWVSDLHIDMLRLDAIHAISDMTAKPFLHELTEAVHDRSHALRRSIHVVAESAANDPRHLRDPSSGGFGMDAQWNDDFHHALHALLTGERQGYYIDFGELDHLAKAYTNGYFFTGQYSHYRGRRHGAPLHGIGPDRFVVYAQNHDQTGNRFLGERISTLTDYESLKLSAGVVCLAPSLPMLFMGEEYAEDRPFLYFTSHTDPELQEAVRRGRKEEGARFGWTDDAPDPQALETFARSRPDHSKRTQGKGRTLWRLYRLLLGMRRQIPALHPTTGQIRSIRVEPAERILYVERVAGPLAPDPSEAVVIYNFSSTPVSGPYRFPSGTWECAVDSAHADWHGPARAAPKAVTVGGGIGDEVDIPVGARGFVVYVRRNSAEA